MRCIIATGTGLSRAAKAWKPLILTWFIYFLMGSLLVLPLKATVRNALSDSSITEKLSGGIDPDVMTDLLESLPGLSTVFFKGLFLLIITGIIINGFITGGLFSSLRKAGNPGSLPEFFSASSKFFWKFTGLSLIIGLIAILAFLFLVMLPVGIIVNLSNSPDKTGFIFSIVFGGIYLVILGMLLLVADYSRAALVAGSVSSFFGALGFGFSETSRSFFPSLGLILLMMAFQGLFTASVLWFAGIWRPETSGGAFILLLVSQLLFSMKVYLKNTRYAAVTALMEINPVRNEKVDQLTQNPQMI